MECKLSNKRKRSEEIITIKGEEVAKRPVGYLGSIIHDNGEIEEQVTHKIKEGWLKWWNATRKHAIKKYPLNSKENSIGQLQDLQCSMGLSVCAATKQQSKYECAEMRTLT